MRRFASKCSITAAAYRTKIGKISFANIFVLLKTVRKETGSGCILCARLSKPITGGEFANASARFALAVASRKLRWHDADAVTDDLVWTTKKPHDESGSYQAVRAQDDRPITAALAAIRAVWMASTPPRTGKAKVY